MTSATPLRFQLTRPLPALWRAPDVLQLGLDQGVLLERVPSALAEAVELLRQPRSSEELAALLPQVGSAWLSWLLNQLRHAGLVREVTDRQPLGVQVLGSGVLAEAVTRSLRAGGFKLNRPRRSSPAGASTELVLLASHTAEPDRALTDTIFREGRDHLVVRVEPDRAVVGPLVQPGRTPCVRCQDLGHVRHEPAWPQLLAQLCRLAVVPDPVLLAWAAATAAAQARAWAGNQPVDSCGTSLELGLPEYRLAARSWAAEAACGCLLPPG